MPTCKATSTAIGVFFIILGVFLNEWVITYAISSDNNIESLPIRIRIWICQAFLILVGTLVLHTRKRLLLHVKELILGSIGIIFILVGILLNEWIIVQVFPLHGKSVIFVVWFIEILFILFGLGIIKYRHRNIVTNIMLLGISTVISILFLEIFLRYAAPRPMIGIGTIHTTKAKLYGWALPQEAKLQFINPDNGKISYFMTNSQGWKDVEHQFEKPNGIFRILFLGDSNTYGVVRLEDLYTRKIEELLKEQGFSNVEVISMGLAGWGPHLALEALMLEGLQYEPDLVIYQFCGNDVTDILLPSKETPPDAPQWNIPFKYELRNGQLVRVERNVQHTQQASINSQPKFMNKSSLIYHIMTLQKRFSRWFHQNTSSGERIAGTYEALQSDHWWDSYPLDPTSPYFPFHPDEESHELQQAWQLLEAIIVRMKTVVEGHNAVFLVFSEQGEEGRRHWHLKWQHIITDGISDYVMWKNEKYPIYWKKPLDNLAEICDKHHIPFIQPERTYERYEYDPHPNALGNVRMAKDIVDFLMNHDLF